MLKIRLKRVGRRNDPSFRMVVTESELGPKSNKFVAHVGSYNPKTKDRQIDAEQVKYWMGVGAQPSDTVFNMLVDAGIASGPKRNALPKKTPIVKDAPATPEAQGEAPVSQGEVAGEVETPQEVPAEEPAKEEKEEATNTEEQPNEEAPKEEDTKEESAPAEA